MRYSRATPFTRTFDASSRPIYNSLADSLGRDPKELGHFRHGVHSFASHDVPIVPSYLE